MRNSKSQNKVPLLNVLQRAFTVSLQAEKPGMPPPDELIEMRQERSIHRRQFMGNVLKTGVVIGAAGLLDACRKLPLPGTINHGLQPKIVIIGAGIAGLNCAYQLKKAGYTSTIYEGATRTGGRIFSGKNLLASGLTTELGGEFIDSGHDDMLQLSQDFGFNLIDTFSPDEANYARDSFYIDGRFYSEKEVITAFQPYASRIADDINSLPAVMTYDDHDSVTLKFDRMSIHAYLDSLGMTGFIRKGIETAYLTEYGLETDVQSSINFLYLFSPDTSQGFEMFGASDERYKIEGGNQSIPNTLYKQLENTVLLGHQLVKVKQNVVGYLLYFTNVNGATTVTYADIIVSAIPFTTLRDVELDVAFPTWKTNAIKNLGYGTNAKLLLGFNRRVWHKYNYNGYAFTDKVLQTGWDNSVGQLGNSGGYTVLQGGTKGMDLAKGTPEQQAPRFIEELDQMWPGAAAAFNGNVKRMHWPTYPFTKGSYACYKVGQYTTIRGAEIKPIGNFYFAGEHCSSENQGYMNGGAETGRITAEAILTSIKRANPVLTNSLSL